MHLVKANYANVNHFVELGITPLEVIVLNLLHE